MNIQKVVCVIAGQLDDQLAEWAAMWNTSHDAKRDEANRLLCVLAEQKKVHQDSCEMCKKGKR